MLRALLGLALVGLAVVVALFALDRWPRAPRPEEWSGSGHGMPIYRSRSVVDPRMPLLDSQLPLRRDPSAKRPRAVPRPWQGKAAAAPT